MIRLLAAFVLLATGALGAEESYSQQIVRENRTQRIVTVLGEVETFKTLALDFMQYLQKKHPEASASYWSRVGSNINSDTFETAIVKHYSSRFTLDELGHLDDLFKTPEMRGVIYWIRILPTQSVDEQKETIEKIQKRYPPATVQAFLNLIDGAWADSCWRPRARRKASAVRRRPPQSRRQ
jgi:hypothetical protein